MVIYIAIGLLYILQLRNASNTVYNMLMGTQFAGFNSMFLYCRLYRCYTSLNGFYYDTGNVEREKNLSIEEFRDKYDGQKPVWCSQLIEAFFF